MVRTKLDNRIRVIVENGVAKGHRSMFVVVGDKGRDQVRSSPFVRRMMTRPKNMKAFVFL
uniref:tRNA(Met) cytidine acetyltransferase TmcA N-terminal domain-containing protein n=2 Tax=Parascaris TaxID=6254 RepID=A0A914RZ85_PAREQ